MNWLIIIVVGIAVLALVIFLITQNQKDEKKFEKQMNEDYHKSKEEEGDIDVDEILK